MFISKCFARLPIAAFIIGVGLFSLAKVSAEEQVSTSSQRLANGIRLVYIQVPGSKNIAIFSILPMGLAADDAKHAQWAHLVEHLVMRTTMPNELTHGNAETLAGRMHLDYYGPPDSWREGLSHHRRWLSGVPFTEASLKAEVPRANSEVDGTAQNLASGKFAIAAWNQAFRHRLDEANIKGDLVAARLADLQRYRDEHLFIPEQTVVCAIGGVDAKTFVDGAAKELGDLASQAKPRKPIEKLPPREAQIRWDVDSTHVQMTWPVPGPSDPKACAALMVLGALLTQQAMTDPQVTALGPYPMIGSDIQSPEGDYFEISMTLRPGIKPHEAQKVLGQLVGAFSHNDPLRKMVGPVAHQMAQSLGPVTMEMINAGAGQAPRWTIEANIGLWTGMNESRYSEHRDAIIKALRQLTANDIDRVINSNLRDDQRTVLTFTPRAP